MMKADDREAPFRDPPAALRNITLPSSLFSNRRVLIPIQSIVEPGLGRPSIPSGTEPVIRIMG